jgi:hypothetical protein
VRRWSGLWSIGTSKCLVEILNGVLGWTRHLWGAAASQYELATA